MSLCACECDCMCVCMLVCVCNSVGANGYVCVCLGVCLVSYPLPTPTRPVIYMLHIIMIKSLHALLISYSSKLHPCVLFFLLPSPYPSFSLSRTLSFALSVALSESIHLSRPWLPFHLCLFRTPVHTSGFVVCFCVVCLVDTVCVSKRTRPPPTHTHIHEHTHPLTRTQK